MDVDRYWGDRLATLQAQGLRRTLTYLSSPQGPRVTIGGREFLLFASNSYLGLGTDPRLKEAARVAMERYGVGAGGSRLTTGSYDIHRRLEEELAHFKGCEGALLFNTGYMANVGVISALADQDWVIFSDAYNHASIVDGCRLSRARVVVYDHASVADLERKMASYRGVSTLVVTDGVFSVDGDIAPLPLLVACAKAAGAIVMVDDAHATGVLGPHGGGTSDLFQLGRQVDIQMGTLSKALASEGGFIAGSAVLIDYLINRARSFVYSTAINPMSCAVSLAALELVRREPERRELLLEKAKWMRERLRDLGLPVAAGQTPIIPLLVGDAEVAVAFSQKLQERCIFVPALRPPTVAPGTSRLRISLMATHTWEDLEYTCRVISEIADQLSIRGHEQ